MKIEKIKGKYSNGVNWFEYYYIDKQNGDWKHHGLYLDYLWWGIGYRYHEERKGFWLKIKKYL